MARIITKELAEKIVDKLGGIKVDSHSKAHDQYAVYHGDVVIAYVSVRRGSAKDKGHDHIPKDLHIGPSQAKRLGQCSWSLDDYLKNLRERGLLGEA